MLLVTASSMDVIYTLPANLSAIGTDQTITVGTVQLDILSPTPETFRDVQVLSKYLQPLPGNKVEFIILLHNLAFAKTSELWSFYCMCTSLPV